MMLFDGRSKPLSAAISLIGTALGYHLAVASGFGTAHSQLASTIAVANCNDAGEGSLRQAFSNAVDGDVIELGGLTCSRITLVSGAIADNQNALGVTIQSTGRRTVIDSHSAHRLIEHNGIRTLTLKNLTIQQYGGPSKDGPGGCVSSQGSVDLILSSMSNCTTQATAPDVAKGGGIYAQDSVNLLSSSISSTTAIALGSNTRGYGGAISARSVSTNYYIDPETHVAGGPPSSITNAHVIAAEGFGGAIGADNSADIQSTTIAHCSASEVGGVFAPSVHMMASTISYNTADATNGTIGVGGVYSKTGVSIYRSTIADNFGRTENLVFGGGITRIDNSIVANSDANGGSTDADFLANTPYAEDFVIHNSIVRVLTFDGLNVPFCEFFGAFEGSQAFICADPLLDPLANNGGGVLTRRPQGMSPAVGAAFPDLKEQDELGNRVLGKPDIGALQETIFATGTD